MSVGVEVEVRIGVEVSVGGVPITVATAVSVEVAVAAPAHILKAEELLRGVGGLLTEKSTALLLKSMQPPAALISLEGFAGAGADLCLRSRSQLCRNLHSPRPRDRSDKKIAAGQRGAVADQCDLAAEAPLEWSRGCQV